jgi:hypothetical protein
VIGTPAASDYSVATLTKGLIIVQAA